MLKIRWLNLRNTAKETKKSTILNRIVKSEKFGLTICD